MCNRYVSPDQRALEEFWHVGARQPWRGGEIFPHKPAPFIRRPRDADETGELRECCIGGFGLVPRWAKDRKPKWGTMNARSETAHKLSSFKAAWAARQWAVIPAWAIVEPYYLPGAGKDDKMDAWWAISRADERPLSIAGLWDWWVDRERSEDDPDRFVLSFTMLTINADEHPLLQRFHRHVDKDGHQEEKRTPVLLRDDQIDAWLSCAAEDASSYLHTLDASELAAGPAGGATRAS